MKANPEPYNIASTYLRLRNDVSVEPLPVDDSFWQRLGSGALGTFHGEFLVTCHSFDADWSTWEVHPNGDEVVCLLSGSVTFILESEYENRTVELHENGAYVIVEKGTWHTARINAPSRMLFITAGEGTEHRQRPNRTGV